MTRLPSDASIAHLADSLVNLSRPRTSPTGKPIGKAPRCAEMAAALIDAVTRDRAGGNPTPDGYPTSTMGDPHRGHGGSSVEATVIALAGRIPRDPHHELTLAMVQAAEETIAAAQRWQSLALSIGDLTRTDGGAKVRTCEWCTPHLPKDNARKVHRRGTVGDRLVQALDLCEPCYFFVVRSTKTGGMRDGVLPTGDQIRHHDTHGTWLVRVPRGRAS